MSIDINVAGGSLSVGGDVVGRDKIINNIQNIVQRALTAAEEAEQDKAIEARYLAQGVKTFAERLQARASDRADTEQSSPYKGLLEYRLSDAEIFFGRSQAIAALLGNLQRGPLTVLHAESGAGKSSLVQAGVMPRLIAAGHLPVYLRPYNVEPALALKRLFISDLGNTPLLATGPLRDFLKQINALVGEACQMFIFLDQFEEFFTQLDEPARAEFVRELAECLGDESLGVRWILSMRTEFFGNLAAFRPTIRNPFENDLRLNRLNREEAREVAIEPARRRGITFETAEVDVMLDDLGGQAVQPPQIQLVCSALYEELAGGEKTITQALYDRLGGAAGILRGHLQRVLNRDLSPEQRQVAERVLEALISADGRRLIRSRAKILVELNAAGLVSDTVSESRTGTTVAPATLDKVLDQLVDSRLVRVHDLSSSAQQGYETTSGLSFELTHDYLLEQIKVDPAVQARKAAQELIEQETHNFERFKTLLSDDKLAILAPRRNELALSDSARKLLDLSEKTARRRQGYLRAGIGFVIVLIIAGVVSALTAFGAEQQRRSAVRAQATAQVEATQALRQKSEAEAAAAQADILRATSEAAGAQSVATAQAAAASQAQAETAAALAVTRAELANAVVQGLFDKSGLVPVGRLPTQLAFDGQRLWVINREDGAIQSIDPASGKAGEPLSVSTEPRVIVFDGERLWVSDAEDGTVTAIDSDTGQPDVVIEVGDEPRGMVVEGNYLWVADYAGSAVYTLDLTQAALVEPAIPVGGGPIALVYDGARIWVANYFSHTVQAIDPRARLTGKIYATPGPWALAFDGRKLWVANYDAHTVTPIDLTQDFTGQPIPVGHNPISLLFDEQRIWVSCYGDNVLQAIDPATQQAGVSIPVGTLPDGMAFDGDRLWVANRQNNTVQAVDPIAGDLLPARSVSEPPTALAFDGRRVWVAYPNRNVIQSLDPHTGAIVSILGAGRNPQRLLFDGKRLWVSNYDDNTVQALEIETNRLRSPIPVNAGPQALAWDGSRLWVANYLSGTVQVIDPEAQAVIAVLPVGNGPAALVHDGRLMWVANQGDQTVQTIEAVTRHADGVTLTVGYGASALAWDGRRVWVANGEDDTVQAIETATRQVEPPLEVGNNPQALFYDGKLLWVANYWSNSVQAIDPATGRVGTAISVGIGPFAFTFDGGQLWIANRDSNSLQNIIVR